MSNIMQQIQNQQCSMKHFLLRQKINKQNDEHQYLLNMVMSSRKIAYLSYESIISQNRIMSSEWFQSKSKIEKKIIKSIKLRTVKGYYNQAIEQYNFIIQLQNCKKNIANNKLKLIEISDSYKIGDCNNINYGKKMTEQRDIIQHCLIIKQNAEYKIGEIKDRIKNKIYSNVILCG